MYLDQEKTNNQNEAKSSNKEQSHQSLNNQQSGQTLRMQQKKSCEEWKQKCISLQKLLKEQHSLLWTENEQKLSFEKKLSQTILLYHRNKIQSSSGIKQPQKPEKQTRRITAKLKQTFEIGESSKSIPSKHRVNQQKILLEDEGFGDSCFYIKEILLSLAKDPELMLTIIRRHHALGLKDNLESIVKAIVHSMYDNIVDDDIYNKDVFVILNECFKLVIQNAKTYNDVRLNEDKSIAGQVVKEFLEKSQIKNYSRQLLKNMVLQISKIDHEVSFSADENEKNDSKSQKDSSGSLGFNAFRLKKLESKDQSPVKDQKLNQKSKLQNTNSKITQYSEGLQVKDEKMRLSHPLQKEKGPRRNRKCVSKQLLKYLGITEQIQFPTFVSSSANNELKKQEEINKQYAAMLSHKESMTQLNPDIILIKNIVLIFFSDLFKMLYTLPLGLRIACKIFYEQLQRKYQSKKGCFYVLAEYLLGLGVVNNIVFEEVGQEKEKEKEKGSKSKPTNHIKTNLSTFANIILSVIRNDFKKIPKSFEYEFNLIVSNLRLSLYNYMNEVINIDTSKMTHLIQRPGTSVSSISSTSLVTAQLATQKIKSFSVCVSVADIKRLFEMIKACKAELININKNDKLMKRIERIEMVTEGKDIFGPREDKKTKQTFPPQNAYIMFFQLQLPKQLSVNYIKYHDGYFKNDKFKKMMKGLLLSIKSLELFTEFHQQSTLFSFLEMLSKKPKQYFSLQSSMSVENIDHVPVEVKVKYLVSLIRNNFTEGEYCQVLLELVQVMYKQVVERTEYYKTIWDTSKETFLKALSSVIFLNQVIVNHEATIVKNQKTKKLQEFIAKTKIAVCLTSPLTREKDIVSKTSIVKDLADDEKSKIWLQNQSRCIHSTLNLEFIKSLTGQPDKMKKEDSHCNSIMKFADVLCSLPEIRSNTAEDVGVKQVFFDFIRYCSDLALSQEEYAEFSDDTAWLEETLEQKLSKKLYDRLYPKDPSYEDVAFYLRLKTLDFVTYSHLKIKECLRNDKMWQLAGRQLRMMDKVKTAGQKLNCIMECSKVIISSYQLINDTDQPASAQDIYPLVVYVLLKAAPKRMISNMTFIEYFASQNRLMSKEGYAYTQLKSAIQFIDHLTEQSLEYEGMTPAEKAVQFRKTIYQKEVQYGIYFLLLRKNTSHEVEAKTVNFLKDFFAQTVNLKN